MSTASPVLRWSLLVLTSVAAFFGIGQSVASAESPIEVAEEVAEDGVFVGFGRPGIDEEALIAAVDNARFDGIRLVAIVPRDPQPSAAAYARRIQEQTDADAALVFPKEGPLETYVIEEFASKRIRATEAAREFTDPARAVEAFVAEVNSEQEEGTPEIVGQILNALVLMTLLVGVVVAVEQGVTRLRRPAQNAK